MSHAAPSASLWGAGLHTSQLRMRTRTASSPASVQVNQSTSTRRVQDVKLDARSYVKIFRIAVFNSFQLAMISIPTYRSPLGRCSAPAIVHLSSIVRRPAELRPRRAAARAGTAANHASADAARADAAPAAAADGAARRYARLLHFAADGINPPKVEVCEQLPGGGGRGLVAAADVPAGGVLLSVPLDRVFTSQVRGRKQ